MPIAKIIYQTDSVLGPHGCLYLEDAPDKITSGGQHVRKAFFKCVCGNTFIQSPYRISSGVVLSCGCKQKRNKPKVECATAQINYARWNALRQRRVLCPSWHADFWKFDRAVNALPKINLHATVFRIDSTHLYKPENIKLATSYEITKHVAVVKSVHYQYRGQSKLLSEWAEHLDLNLDTLKSRVKRGWSIDRILATKPKVDGRTSAPKNKLWMYQGETKSLRDWCCKYDRHELTVRMRITKGWSLDRALTTPTKLPYLAPYK